MYKISPSDFAYLYEECKFCYWLKVKKGIYQPSMPMPGVFGAINTRIQTPLVGKELTSINKDLPEGTVVLQEGWVESKPIPGTDLYIKGKYDLLVKRPDGSHMLVDLKISQAGEDKIEKYRTQLSAYKFALGNPAKGTPVKITKMGLLVLYPDSSVFEDEIVKITFPPKWLEITADNEGFLSFTKGIDKLLSGPAPEEGKKCKWCAYRHMGEEIAHEEKKGPIQGDIPF